MQNQLALVVTASIGKQNEAADTSVHHAEMISPGIEVAASRLPSNAQYS